MRNLIMAGLMATSLLPAAAQAQWIDRDHGQYRDNNRDEHRGWDRREWGHHDWDRRDWRGDRDGYRDGYRRYGYDQPRYRYNNYSLPRAGWGQRWVRRGRDVLLVDVRNGYVVDVIRNFYW